MKQLIGLCGVARSGKDTFYKLAKTYLEQYNIACMRHSLADALKHELDPLFKYQLGFSSFTETASEKELSRNVMVAWGQLRRAQNDFYWIDTIKNNLVNGVNIITDIRFKNEIEYVKSSGGKVVYVERLDENNHTIEPINDSERTDTTPLAAIADYKLTWNTVGNTDVHLLSAQVENTFKMLGYCYPPQAIQQ